MRRFSIKKRVTLWYTGMIAVVLAAVFAGAAARQYACGISQRDEASVS